MKCELQLAWQAARNLEICGCEREASVAQGRATLSTQLPCAAVGPGLVTLNTMLEVHSSTGNIAAAERIFSRLERSRKEGPTVNSFTLMIAAYARVSLGVLTPGSRHSPGVLCATSSTTLTASTT